MSNWTIAAWAVGILIGLYAFHRVALWLEREGWIRYIHSAPPDATSGGGAVLGELQRIFEPQTRHVYEMKEQKQVRKEADGGEPERPA